MLSIQNQVSKDTSMIRNEIQLDTRFVWTTRGISINLMGNFGSSTEFPFIIIIPNWLKIFVPKPNQPPEIRTSEKAKCNNNIEHFPPLFFPSTFSPLLSMSRKFKKDIARSQTLSQISCFSDNFGQSSLQLPSSQRNQQLSSGSGLHSNEERTLGS